MLLLSVHKSQAKRNLECGFKSLKSPLSSIFSSVQHGVRTLLLCFLSIAFWNISLKNIDTHFYAKTL